MVSSPGTIGVELLGLDSMISEVASSRGFARNVSSRRDVISGDRVSNIQQDVGTGDVGGGRDIQGLV